MKSIFVFTLLVASISVAGEKTLIDCKVTEVKDSTFFAWLDTDKDSEVSVTFDERTTTRTAKIGGHKFREDGDLIAPITNGISTLAFKVVRTETEEYSIFSALYSPTHEGFLSGRKRNGPSDSYGQWITIANLTCH